uniref:LysM domain-containing protein n=1 Tax=Daucus carota subsp. sativus TaxID=79200 RepID=A0A164W9U1_DAUCS
MFSVSCFGLLILSSVFVSVHSECSRGCGLALGSYYVWPESNLTIISDFTNIRIEEIVSYNKQLIPNQNSVQSDIRINIPFPCDCINGEFLGHVFNTGGLGLSLRISSGGIAGISVAAIAGLLLFAGCFYVVYYRKRRVAKIELSPAAEDQSIQVQQKSPQAISLAAVGFLGTLGYAQYGDVSPKVDVYAFGVVLYELISAKDAIVKANGSMTESKGLVALFEEVLNQPTPKDDLTKLVDPRLGDSYLVDSVRKMAQLAKACTQENPQLRPSMRSIVVALMTLSSSTEDWDIGSFYENHALVNLMSGR